MQPGNLAISATIQQVEGSHAALVHATFGQAESSKLELSSKVVSSLQPIQEATIVAALSSLFVSTNLTSKALSKAHLNSKKKCAQI